MDKEPKESKATHEAHELIDCLIACATKVQKDPAGNLTLTWKEALHFALAAHCEMPCDNDPPHRPTRARDK